MPFVLEICESLQTIIAVDKLIDSYEIWINSDENASVSLDNRTIVIT